MFQMANDERNFLRLSEYVFNSVSQCQAMAIVCESMLYPNRSERLKNGTLLELQDYVNIVYNRITDSQQKMRMHFKENAKNDILKYIRQSYHHHQTVCISRCVRICLQLLCVISHFSAAS